MSDYVKVCPRCGHRNDELASICEQDGEFLGMVPAIADNLAGTAQFDRVPGVPQSQETRSENSGQEVNEVRGVVLAPGENLPAKALYLDIESVGQCYPVKDGWTIGQSHPTSTAEIQLSDLPGINYVHRRHCTFEFTDNQWWVRPLAQPEYTNPTFRNDKKLLPGESFPLQNGDTLRLASIAIRTRIVEL